MRRSSIFLSLGAIISLLFCFASPDHAHTATTRRPKVLVIVYDAGETLGLLPVAPVLEREKTELLWAPLTPWSLRIVQEKHQNYVAPPEGLETMPHVKDRAADGSMDFWLTAVAKEKPDLVILGLVSRAQEQLAHELKARGIRTIGFYDAFDPTTRDTIVARVARQVDTVWVPTATVERNLKELGMKDVRVLGQPSLETWYRSSETANSRELYHRLQIPPGKKVLLFAGQYGEGYPEILEAFLSVATVELDLLADLYLVLSYHPKTNGELEREAMKKHSHSRVILMPPGMGTAELANISSAVITWRSTVGIQAAFLGKPILYFNFNRQDYSNELIERGLALASTPATFGSDLKQALTRQTSAKANRQRLSKLGYVIDADQKIAAEVVRLVRAR